MARVAQDGGVGVVVSEVVIDCADPARVAAFWAEVLGWRAQPDPEGYFWMSASGVDEENDLKLVFVPVPEPKSVKNRVHLDLSPQGADQDDELQRLLSLGARHADIGQEQGLSWYVLADPEGNEFCLLHTRRG